MSIPVGISTVTRIVKSGMGGPNKDSIPVYDKVTPGTQLGYLQNWAVVKIVNPADIEAEHYRKVWNNSIWVLYELVSGVGIVTGWAEENGHLAVAPAPIPAPAPTNALVGKYLITIEKVD
jgi:hypothetical protein